MSEIRAKTADLVRLALAILIFGGLLIGLAWKVSRLREELEAYRNAPADTVVVVRVDTVRVDSPVPVYKYIRTWDTVTICHELRDTVKELIYLPREVMVYKDSTYRAVVSGVQPRLDSIEIYRPTVTSTVTKYVEVKKKTRWGLGVQAGAGFDGKKVQPYVGVGVQYNLLSW